VSGEGGNTGNAVRHEGLVHVPGPLRSVASAALAIACGALVVLAVVEAWQVVARYILDSPAAWTEPVALLALKVALMLATWELKTPGVPLPVGLNFAPFVAGGALMALFAFERLRRTPPA